MAELKGVFEMVTKQVEPDQDAWKEQERRKPRAARNRKVGAITLVAALVAGAVTFAVLSRPTENGTPATQPPKVSLNTTPPIGAQIVDLNGTALQQMPPDIPTITSLQLSPSGTTVAFFDSSGELATIRTDGTGFRELTSGMVPDIGDAENGVSWSPDGTKIAYTADNEIYVTNVDGSDQRRLTHSPAGGGSYQPAWSADGSTIAYWRTAARTGEAGGPTDAEIYTIPATGGTPTRLTFDNVPSIAPTWQQPRGTRIIYRKSRDQRLWIMRDDGKDTGPVSANLHNPWSPVWSPDGSKIAFLSCCIVTGSPPLLEVQVLDLATGKVKGLHMDVASDQPAPQWTSNSTLLVDRNH